MKAQDLWAYRLDASAEVPDDIRAFARGAEVVRGSRRYVVFLPWIAVALTAGFLGQRKDATAWHAS